MTTEQPAPRDCAVLGCHVDGCAACLATPADDDEDLGCGEDGCGLPTRFGGLYLCNDCYDTGGSPWG